jgi:hypothetical protein
MTDLAEQFRDERPMFEVRVMRHGDLVHHEQTETLEQAAAVVAEWDGEDGVVCEVIDLLHGDRPDDEFSDVAREVDMPYDDPATDTGDV